jgi:DNA polymerase
MKTDSLHILFQEYQKLWAEHGVESPVLNVTQGAVMAKTQNKIISKKPIPPIPLEKAPAIHSLEDIQKWIGDCRRCRLCEGRNKIVFGTGNPKTKLMFVGEAPGADEDKQGLPFVGRAGQLLNKIIEAMGYQREQIYIANSVKCRPPENRAPEKDEIAHCSPFLKAQIELIKPTIIVGLGLYASQTLTQTELPISQMRGKFQKLGWDPSIAVMPTYHPAHRNRFYPYYDCSSWH